MKEKEYKLNIDPRILELLGPSLYTNIYYVLAELIANAYDADAHNVYIIANKDDITVEDDGKGMSYADGDIQKYLNVAAVSRNTDAESLTPMKRKKMGRKGVGKLAALSVSENVLIKTISNGEKSGFVLSRHINDNNLLVPLTDEQISFERVSGNGTSVVMQNPQYKLHSTLKAIKRNLLKIFPLVNEKFKIHLIRGTEAETIENFDKEMISELSTLITLGDEFTYLNDFFQTPYGNEIAELRKNKPLATMPISMDDKSGVEHTYNVEINVPPEDIIYTNCDDEVSRIPEGDVGKSGIYDYLRDFFVDSYSTQKIYVIFVTSHNTKSSWGALMEVGAAWITQVEHKIFNIYDFRPEHPLDDEQQWHSSSRDDDGNLYMSKLSVDIFAQKIEYICDKLGYKKRTRQENKDHLSTLVKVTPR